MPDYQQFFDYVDSRYNELKPTWAIDQHASCVNLKTALELISQDKYECPWETLTKLATISTKTRERLRAFLSLWELNYPELTTNQQQTLFYLPLHVQGELASLLPQDQLSLITRIYQDRLVVSEIINEAKLLTKSAYERGDYDGLIGELTDRVNAVGSRLRANKRDLDLAQRYSELNTTLMALKKQRSRLQQLYPLLSGVN